MEPPDFDQIARTLKNFIDDHPQLAEQNVRTLAAQLRLVWNARGAADIALIETEWQPGPSAASIGRALRTLDR